MHGCDLIVMLKCSERLRNIPILAVSGANLDEPRLEVLTRFDIPLLPKPWQAPEFLERFENVLMGMRVFQKPLPAAQGETP
jgi:CheY-like chemotaxis protein